MESRAVTFSHFKMVDEMQVTQRLAMLYNIGVPVEELIKYEPLLQDRQKEIADAIARQGLGMDEYREGATNENA